jgi:tRNA (mo5U34)-methyltransferase
VSPFELLRNDALQLAEYGSNIDLAALLRDREEVFSQVGASRRVRFLQKLSILRTLAPKDVNLAVSDPVVSLSATGGSDDFQDVLSDCATEMIPWRKGPFNFFGIECDSEWRSDLKFDRLKLSAAQIQGRRIADVGCGNGYYMLRLLGYEPKLVVGFDPTDRYLLQYLFIRTLIPNTVPIVLEPLRSSALGYFPNFFDLSLCMGVFYHHPEPDVLLCELFDSIAPGGELYLETLYSPEETSLNLGGEKTYARMKNVYLVPTQDELKARLAQTGFTEVECIAAHELSTDEQRKTSFARGNSLENFLDPKDFSRTVEGYFRPHRTIFRATRPK